MNAPWDRCAVCLHRRWLHWFSREPFYRTSPLRDTIAHAERILRGASRG